MGDGAKGMSESTILPLQELRSEATPKSIEIRCYPVFPRA
jgi:hypothetical protein